jgi:hypothetical protein
MSKEVLRELTVALSDGIQTFQLSEQYHGNLVPSYRNYQVIKYLKTKNLHRHEKHIVSD